MATRFHHPRLSIRIRHHHIAGLSHHLHRFLHNRSTNKSHYLVLPSLNHLYNSNNSLFTRLHSTIRDPLHYRNPLSRELVKP